MSDIKLGSFIDTDNASDIVNDTIGIFKRSMTAIFEEDLFNGQSNFKAVIISNPKSISQSEYKALGFPGSDSKSDRGGYKKFKVRITQKKANPHAILEDPCDITKAVDVSSQNSLIAAHTTVVTEVTTGVNIGSYIEIHLNKNSNGTYNLQTGHFIRVIEKNETASTILDAAVCSTIKNYFVYGESYLAAPALTVSSTISEYAARYDSDTTIPRTRNHGPYFTTGNARTLTPPFDK